MERELIVVGGGIAGLQCAQDLHRAGRRVRVLERARGVGGRCATRRFDGQPIDFGPMFLHGHVPGFLQAALAVEGANRGVEVWPLRVEGRGQPCQVNAFDEAEQRVALPSGLNSFAKHLAQGLEVRLQTRVTGIALEGDRFLLATAEGGTFACHDLVLALALEETLELLATLEPQPELASVQALLGMFTSIPSLTLLAAYSQEVAAPAWDLLYPSDSDCLQLIALDSRKRREPKHLTLVIQARSQWSRERLGLPEGAWSEELLKAAAERAGEWVLHPIWQSPHRWRFARVDRGNELAWPVLMRFKEGPRLGLAGDVFAPGGGVQAAWLSGSALSQRFITEDKR
jgi:hypothetical protein